MKAHTCLEEHFWRIFSVCAWVVGMGMCVGIGFVCMFRSGWVLDVGVCAGCRRVRAELTLAGRDESLGRSTL